MPDRIPLLVYSLGRNSIRRFRLTLAATGFALYGYGKTQKQRNQNARTGTGETHLVRGLGGWLIVLGVMLAVTLVEAVIQAITDIPRILDGNVWAAYTTPGQPAYHQGWAALLALDWGSNLYVLVFFPVLLSLFLQKKKTFRALTVGTLALSSCCRHSGFGRSITSRTFLRPSRRRSSGPWSLRSARRPSGFLTFSSPVVRERPSTSKSRYSAFPDSCLLIENRALFSAATFDG